MPEDADRPLIPQTPAAPATTNDASSVAQPGGLSPETDSSPSGSMGDPSPGPTANRSESKSQDKPLESTVIEVGENLEAAAKQFGNKLDEKFLSGSTGRDVKEKVGGFWNRIKEKIQ